MYHEDLFDDETNHGLSLKVKDIQEGAIEQALMQCANPSGALAKACIESILNPPPPFESDDDEVDHDQMNVTDTPPNTDLTLPVPTAVKAIMAEDICRQQNPHALTFLAELDEEMSSTYPRRWEMPPKPLSPGSPEAIVPLLIHVGVSQLVRGVVRQQRKPRGVRVGVPG